MCLDLSYNSMSTSIPTVGMLTALTYLDLSDVAAWAGANGLFRELSSLEVSWFGQHSTMGRVSFFCDPEVVLIVDVNRFECFFVDLSAILIRNS
jgi:hypothetical protein